MRERHGFANTPTYRSWQEMRDRCLRPTHTNTPTYRSWQETVCQRWVVSFAAFLEDMGVRPAGTTLDRVNGTKGYEPSNCRWVTLSEQARNQRLRSSNRTGVKGVFLRAGKYDVHIRDNGQKQHLGRTSDLFEAACLRKSAENFFYHA